MPPAGSDSGLVWDLAGGYYVLFGGYSATQSATNQTWLYYAGTWVNATGTLHTAPSPRADVAMSWDPNLQAVVLFGGCSAMGCPLQDTWKFSGSWTNITGTACSSACPTPSYGASIGWDSADKVTILFGGCMTSSVLGCSATGNETSELGSNGHWSILSYPRAPGPRFFAASYGLYVYGGSYPCGGFGTCDFSDFWEFQTVASGWTNLSRITGGNPGGLAQAALGLDWSTGYLVLFGGYNDSTFAIGNSTWNFHCQSAFSCYWVNVSAGSHPPYRYAMAYSSDRTSHAFWFEGGLNASFGAMHDDWAYGVPPTGLSLVTAPGVTEPGKTVYANSSVTGGTAPFNASWSFPELGTVWKGEPANWTASFPRVGTFHIELTIQDLHGFLIAATQTVSVVPPPEFNISGPSAGDAGITMSFSALATIGKGLPPYQYAWSWGDSASGSGSAPQHTYALPGSYTVNVTQTDRVGGQARLSVSLVAHASPKIAATASATTIDPGMSIAFSATGSLGTAPYTFTWAFGDGGAASSARANHSFAAPGTVIVTATIADAAGATANSTLSVSVNAALGGTAQANRTSVKVGEPVRFGASASGGEPPYAYGWSFGTAGQANGTPVDHAFSSPGRFPVTLTIRDAFGQSVVQTLTVNVTAAPPPGGGGGSSTGKPPSGLSITSPFVLGGLALALVVVALTAALLVVRRRKRPPPKRKGAATRPDAEPSPGASPPTA